MYLGITLTTLFKVDICSDAPLGAKGISTFGEKNAPHGKWQCTITKKMLGIVLAVCWFQSKIRLTSGRLDPASLSYGGALLAGDHSLPTWLMWDWQSGEVLLSFIWNSKKQCPWLRVQEYICSISRHDINTHVEL